MSVEQVKRLGAATSGLAIGGSCTALSPEYAPTHPSSDVHVFPQYVNDYGGIRREFVEEET